MLLTLICCLSQRVPIQGEEATPAGKCSGSWGQLLMLLTSTCHLNQGALLKVRKLMLVWRYLGPVADAVDVHLEPGGRQGSGQDACPVLAPHAEQVLAVVIILQAVRTMRV